MSMKKRCPSSKIISKKNGIIIKRGSVDKEGKKVIDNEMSEGGDERENELIVEEIELLKSQPKGQGKFPIMLLKSVYEGRGPTIFFQYAKACEKKREESRAYYVSESLGKQLKLKYKSNVRAPFYCVTVSLKMAGFERTEDND